MIHDDKSMFLQLHVGEAKVDGEVIYEFGNSMGNGAPIIRSAKTGKSWTIDWTELIELAQKEGIDE